MGDQALPKQLPSDTPKYCATCECTGEMPEDELEAKSCIGEYGCKECQTTGSQNTEDGKCRVGPSRHYPGCDGDWRPLCMMGRRALEKPTSWLLPPAEGWTAPTDRRGYSDAPAPTLRW